MMTELGRSSASVPCHRDGRAWLGGDKPLIDSHGAAIRMTQSPTGLARARPAQPRQTGFFVLLNMSQAAIVARRAEHACSRAGPGSEGPRELQDALSSGLASPTRSDGGGGSGGPESNAAPYQPASTPSVSRGTAARHQGGPQSPGLIILRSTKAGGSTPVLGDAIRESCVEDSRYNLR
ncbi:uncharacterized protein B0I36DRAFT_95992 [Microdochium trichocladiopsis]|uniref:Uncharacterized protein n=1 Tax=Microdochium trichocladiopsis TaxID=1682393 RepID=A0A9P9BT92_9PEZI|nr:uncharacterized protein B0I36DRAFT_95992 [Microdochium trichocladiopsis]KAH7035715.1 hypothetical protein B0I36DRAFT_95992 [Microdochium trichocladiopsis]